MKQKYPRINWGGLGSEKRKTCRVCFRHTREVLCIEYNRMRGDDAVYKVCKDCKKELRSCYENTDVDQVLRMIDPDYKPELAERVELLVPPSAND